MNRDSLRTTLEVSTNVAILLVAVAVLTVIGFTFVKSSGPKLNPGLAKGTNFGQLANVDYRRNARTLLIALDANCAVCTESAELYRKLVASNEKSRRPLQIMAIFPNTQTEAQKYLRETQLTMDFAANNDFPSLRIAGTPTVILLADTGEVKDFWIGKLNDREGEELINALFTE